MLRPSYTIARLPSKSILWKGKSFSEYDMHMERAWLFSVLPTACGATDKDRTKCPERFWVLSKFRTQRRCWSYFLSLKQTLHSRHKRVLASKKRPLLRCNRLPYWPHGFDSHVRESFAHLHADYRQLVTTGHNDSVVPMDALCPLHSNQHFNDVCPQSAGWFKQHFDNLTKSVR